MMRLIAFAMLMLATPAHAQDKVPAEPVRAAPAQLRSDRAYILFRTNRFKLGIQTAGPVFMRVPSEAELADDENARERAFDSALPSLTSDYEKQKAKGKPVAPPSLENFPFVYGGATNVFVVKGGDSFDDAGPYRAYLIAVQPGTYVLYGVTWGTSYLNTCNCLGTVAFAAKAGAITDIGTLMMDKTFQRSKIPELAEESDFGHPPAGAMSILGTAIRLGGDAEWKPAGLGAFAITRADFRAVGPYFEAGAISINRLAPIEGILGYRKGQVIDVHSNAVVPPGEIAR